MNALTLHRSMLTLTNKCTLNCLYCSAYVPLYSTPPHYTFEQLKSYVKRYFELVDYVDIFTLTGGEPLLHEDVDKVVDFFDLFHYQVGRLCLITNGTLIPSQSLLEALAHYRGDRYVLLDDYGEVSACCDQVQQALKEAEVPYERRKYNGDNPYCNGWVDNWDLKRKFLSDEEIKYNHSVCETAQHDNLCMIIKGGVIYPCGPVHWCVMNGIVNDADNSEHLNIMDLSIDKSYFAKWAQSMYQAPFFRSCAFCSGINKDSVRHKPAQQIG